METKMALTKDKEADEVDYVLVLVFRSLPRLHISMLLRESLSTLRANPIWAYGILENHLLTWKLSLIVIMMGQTLTGNPQQLVVNFSTGGIKVSSGIEEINTGSLDVNTGIDPVTTDSIRVSVPSPDRGRREGKAPI
ncbi:hypothetical protein Tco_0192148 [Tanacetum coccineum]